MAEQSREPEILKSIIDDTEYNKTPQSRNEEILLSILNDTEYTKTPQSREEELLLELKDKIGHGITVEPLSVTENGTYTAPTGKAYSPVEVNITPPQLVKRVTGNPVEFSDGADAPVVKCVTAITGSQDLHGYDKPWVGGAGKNKLDTILSDIKALNTTGTWTGNNYSVNGIVFSILTDSANNVIGIKATGTASANSSLVICNNPGLIEGMNYIMTGCPAEGSDSKYRLSYSNNVDSAYADYGSSVQITEFSHSYQFRTVRITIFNEYSIPTNGLVFYPMIRLTSVTDPTFAPYSNICPISAYTEGEIKVRGLNCIPDGTDTTKGYKSGYILKKDGTTQSNFNYCISEYFKIEPNADYTYCIYPTVTGGIIGFCYYNTNKEYIIGDNIGNGTTTLTAPSNAVYARATIPSDLNTTYKILVFKGRQRPSEWVAYINNQSTTTYPSAIYRGSEDVVEGEVTSEKKLKEFTGGWSIYDGVLYIDNDVTDGKVAELVCNMYGFGAVIQSLAGAKQYPNCICCQNLNGIRLAIYDPSYTDATTFNTFIASNPLQVAYELLTPTTSSVTPTNLPIRTLSGYNHIESSTGEMEIEYITEGYQPLVDLIQSSNGHTYSTQEQVVGKWIDGSDLYERTITIPNVSITTGASQMYYSLIDLSSYLTGLDKAFPDIDKSYIVMQDTTVRRLVWIDYQSTDAVIVYSLSSRSSVTLVLTLQYTKSTTTRSLSAPLTSQKAQIEPLTDKTEEVPTEEEKAVNEEDNNDETR